MYSLAALRTPSTPSSYDHMYAVVNSGTSGTGSLSRTDSMEYHFSGSGTSVDIHSLPPELLMIIFEELDIGSVWSCLFTCRGWRHASERVIYASPRLSSASGLKRFVSVLEHKKILGDAVRRLHIRGKANYSSTQSTEWILEVPNYLAHLIPNVRSLTFENVENTVAHRAPSGFVSWKDMKCFAGVTQLHITDSRFQRPGDLRDLIFSFPSLSTLTLSHVRWDGPTNAPRGEKPPAHDTESWKRVLPLQTLRVGYLSSVSDYRDVFTWLQHLKTVRFLEVENVLANDLWVLSKYLTRLVQCGGSLESFTFCPLVLQGVGMEHIQQLGDVLKTQKRLSELNLRITNLFVMQWVPAVLDAVSGLPLTRVALEFTLDVYNAASPSEEFRNTNDRLCRYWKKTLRQVTLLHHPTGNFIPDAQVPIILSSRCPSLVERGILDVRLGVRYDDV